MTTINTVTRNQIKLDNGNTFIMIEGEWVDLTTYLASIIALFDDNDYIVVECKLTGNITFGDKDDD